MRENNYYDILKVNSSFKIAPFSKRLLSGFIDILAIYTFYLIMLIATHHQFPFMKPMTFIFSLFYFLWSYSVYNQTIGNKILKIKIKYVQEISNKKKYYFLRSIYKSLLLVPLFSIAFYIIICGITIFGIFLMMKDPIIRKNCALPWDILSMVVVIEEN